MIVSGPAQLRDRGIDPQDDPQIADFVERRAQGAGGQEDGRRAVLAGQRHQFGGIFIAGLRPEVDRMVEREDQRLSLAENARAYAVACPCLWQS